MTRKLILALALLLTIWPLAAQEEDLPIIPYFNASSDGFHVPVPDGWEDLSESNTAHFTSSARVQIYAIAEGDEDADVAAMLADLRPVGDLRYSGEFSLEGLAWEKYLYETAEGFDATALVHRRDGSTYILALFNDNPEIDYYALTARVEDGEDTVEQVNAVVAELYPEFDTEPVSSDTVELSNGTWERNVYNLEDDETLHVIHQLRGRTAYIVVERGDGAMLAEVNKMLFTTLFGFFVTPANQAYLYLGLAAIFGLIGALVVSMVLRQRSLEQDMRMIEQLEQGS